MRKQEIVRDEWRVLSDKFVRHHRLPFGTKLVLEHSRRGTGVRPRKARNDTTFSRRLFRGRILDDGTVADMFNDYLLPALLVNPLDRGLRIKLRGPNGEEVKRPKNTLIRTVRRWPPLPTPDEVEEQEQLNSEIEEIADMADLELRGAEELRDNSERVLRGYLRALIRRYGLHEFRSAVTLET